MWWRPALIMFSQVSGWIVGPIIVATLLGKYLDKKFHTHPYFFIGLMVVSFTLSMVKIVKVTSQQIKKIEREAEKKKQQELLKEK